MEWNVRDVGRARSERNVNKYLALSMTHWNLYSCIYVYVCFAHKNTFLATKHIFCTLTVWYQLVFGVWLVRCLEHSVTEDKKSEDRSACNGAKLRRWEISTFSSSRINLCAVQHREKERDKWIDVISSWLENTISNYFNYFGTNEPCQSRFIGFG